MTELATTSSVSPSSPSSSLSASPSSSPSEVFDGPILTRGEILDAAGYTGLARVVTGSSVRLTNWAVRSAVGAAVDIAREVGSGKPIMQIVDSRVQTARHIAWRALGVKEQATDRGVPETLVAHPSSYRDLRAQGDALLAASCDSTVQPRDEHPAFQIILNELVPDEARILRFMAVSGPQPAIDIRTKTPFGVGSERLAGGINMIAEMAGCQYPERNQHYLANLNRLGMLRFSEEQVDDPRRYSFIEAQPVAHEAMAKAKSAVTVYRSIYLSLFGKQFCEVCFTLDGYDAGGWIRDIR